MTEAWKQWEGHTVKGVFDHYDIGRPLGQPESGAVFLTGRGAQKDHKAAIKLIPAEGSRAEQYLARWKLAEKLTHPNLIGIFDMGRCRLGDADLVFVVMECADEDLAQVLPERALTAKESLEMLRPALDALLSLHRQGFVLGHIEPANIMAVGNRVKLASDGLCRAGEPWSSVGSPGAFAPPESALPESAGGVIATSADVWSLGMTLAEVLTQRRPVVEPGGGDPVITPELPAPFAEIVRQCLRRDPQARCSVADIMAILNPPAASTRTQPRPARSQRPLAVPLATAALVVAAIAGGWQWLQSHSEDRERVTAAVPEKKAEAPPVKSSGPPVRQQKPAPVITRPAPVHVEAPERAAAAPAPLPEKSVAGDARNGVVREVIPDVPRKAMETIRGTIVVKVRVQADASGNVMGADLDVHGPSEYFARQALKAAQGWKFTPGEGGAPRSWILQFNFTSSEASASAARVGA